MRSIRTDMLSTVKCSYQCDSYYCLWDYWATIWLRHRDAPVLLSMALILYWSPPTAWGQESERTAAVWVLFEGGAETLVSPFDTITCKTSNCRIQLDAVKLIFLLLLALNASKHSFNHGEIVYWQKTIIRIMMLEETILCFRAFYKM